MAEDQRPLAPHTLSVQAARTLSHPTLTVPHMLAETPRWLLHLLPWVNVPGGVYQINRRRIVLRQSGRITAHLGEDKARLDPEALRALSLLRAGDATLLGAIAELLVEERAEPAMTSTKKVTRAKNSTSSSKAKSKSRRPMPMARNFGSRSMAMATFLARPRCSATGVIPPPRRP